MVPGRLPLIATTATRFEDGAGAAPDRAIPGGLESRCHHYEHSVRDSQRAVRSLCVWSAVACYTVPITNLGTPAWRRSRGTSRGRDTWPTYCACGRKAADRRRAIRWARRRCGGLPSSGRKAVSAWALRAGRPVRLLGRRDRVEFGGLITAGRGREVMRRTDRVAPGDVLRAFRRKSPRRRLSRSPSWAQSGPQSASEPLDCGLAAAILHLLRLRR